MRCTRVQDLSHSSALTSGPREETRPAYWVPHGFEAARVILCKSFEVEAGLQDAHSLPDPHLVVDLWVAVVKLDQRAGGARDGWDA